MKTQLTLSLLLCVVVCLISSAVYGEIEQPTKRINLDAKDLPLAKVLDTLFKDTGLSYAIDPTIAQLRVTAVLKNVSFDTALRNISKAAGVVYKIDGGAYVFELKPSGAPHVPISTETPMPEGIVERIPLQFVEPPDVVPVLQMDRTVLVVGSGPSFVVIKGSEDAVEKAKRTIRMLDTPDAFPQAVRIKLSARITVQEPGKPSKTYEASSESVGAAGDEMPLQIMAAALGQPGPIAKASTPPRGEMTAVEARLTPLVDGHGKISLLGGGNIRGDLPIHFEKAFQVATASVSGQKTVIAAGSAALDAGKVEFEVAVVPTVEKDRVKRPMGRPEPALRPGPVGPGAQGKPSGPDSPGPGMRPPGYPLPEPGRPEANPKMEPGQQPRPPGQPGGPPPQGLPQGLPNGLPPGPRLSPESPPGPPPQ